MEPWKRVTTGDPVIEELQDNAEPIMKRVEGAFSLDGVLLKKKTINGATIVTHGLGRVPQGFVVIRRRGNVVVYDDQDNNNNAAKTLKLNSASSVEVDLWVF